MNLVKSSVLVLLLACCTSTEATSINKLAAKKVYNKMQHRARHYVRSTVHHRMRDAKSDAEEKDADVIAQSEEEKRGPVKRAPQEIERREAPDMERKGAPEREVEESGNGKEGEEAEVQNLRRSDGANYGRRETAEEASQDVEEKTEPAREAPEEKHSKEDGHDHDEMEKEREEHEHEHADVLTVKVLDQKLANFKREIVDELKTSLSAAVKVMAQGECEGWCKKIQKTAGDSAAIAKDEEATGKTVEVDMDQDKATEKEAEEDKKNLVASQPHHVKSKWATYREEQKAAGEVPSADAFDTINLRQRS